MGGVFFEVLLQPCNLYCLSLLLALKQQRRPLSLVAASCMPASEIIIIIIVIIIILRGRQLRTRNSDVSTGAFPQCWWGAAPRRGEGAGGGSGFTLGARCVSGVPATSPAGVRTRLQSPVTHLRPLKPARPQSWVEVGARRGGAHLFCIMRLKPSRAQRNPPAGGSWLRGG